MHSCLVFGPEAARDDQDALEIAEERWGADACVGACELPREISWEVGTRYVIHSNSLICRELTAKLDTVLYGPFFKLLVGNCHLNRPTDEMILTAGAWENIELEMVGQKEAEWGVFPHVSGRVVKGAPYS